ncbi:hypothetical protein NGRA_0298 [Nosema granulosis]|uniref:Uncharacterized protein n=1 Tax=Nosema granulosis TaxID=83296 RepID=A0A9P6L099_9MICR|nr:hypothetical protein NGRA_0298 [Nosema granulosis]
MICVFFWLTIVKNTDLQYTGIDSSFEDEWEMIGNFLNIKEHEKKQSNTENIFYVQNLEDRQFIKKKIDYTDIIEYYCQDLKRNNYDLNETKNGIETDTTPDQNNKRKLIISQNTEKCCKRQKTKPQKQESKDDSINLGEVVVRPSRALKKCKCVFDVIYTILRNIEIFFNINLQVKEIPQKLSTDIQAKHIRQNLENSLKHLLFFLDKNSLPISKSIESVSARLDLIALDISMRISKHNSNDIEWNDIIDHRYKQIYEKEKFKDLIILLIYQIKKTKKPIEEVNSVLLQAFSSGFDGRLRTKRLIIKTILLVKAGSIPGHENLKNAFYFKINTILKKILIQYFWKDAIRLHTPKVDNLKNSLQSLPENEQSVLPLKKESIIFHFTYFRIKERIFDNYVYPFIYCENKNSKLKRKICDAYSTLTCSMDLINKIADSLSSKTQIIQTKI